MKDEFGGVIVNEFIKSKNHKLGTYEIDKIFLSCFFDDKRYVR